METFVTVLSAIGGLEFIKWAVNRIFFRKQEEMKSTATAKKVAIEAEKAIRDMYEETISELRQGYTDRISELQSANRELNEYNMGMIKSNAKKDDIIDEKTKKIRELNEEVVMMTRKIGELEKKLLHYTSWFCKREFGKGKEECTRRLPAQNPPLKYTPIEDDKNENTN